MLFGKPLIHVQEESMYAKGEILDKVSQGAACRRGAKGDRHVSLVLVSARSAEKHMVCLVEVFDADRTWSQVLSSAFTIPELREGE